MEEPEKIQVTEVIIEEQSAPALAEQPKRGLTLSIPGAIVLAGLIIAASIFVTNGGISTGTTGIKTVAARADIKERPFKACLAKGTYADKIDASSKEGLALGIDGTPFSVLATKTGVVAVVGGALPYELWQKAIDTLPTTPAKSGSAYVFDPINQTYGTAAFGSVRMPDNTDHTLGSKDAEVTIIEYSDTECPYCKALHSTLHDLVKNYNGKVAWVYRHFPLDSLHAKARREAEATECAAEVGGNDGFWRYLDALFEATPSNDGFDLEML